VLEQQARQEPSEAAPTAANSVKRSVETGGWRPANASADPRVPGLQLTVADLIHHGRDGKHFAHIDAERLCGNDS
jgi:hypothetical protein